jgi:hypothetical protein
MTQDVQAQLDSLNARVTALEQQQSAVAPAPGGGGAASPPYQGPELVSGSGKPAVFGTASAIFPFVAHAGVNELITAYTPEGGQRPAPGAKISILESPTGPAIASADSISMDNYARLTPDNLEAGKTYYFLVERTTEGGGYAQFV